MSGKIAQISCSDAAVKPTPTASEREAIVMFLWLKPQAAIICM